MKINLKVNIVQNVYFKSTCSIFHKINNYKNTIFINYVTF